MTGDSGEMEGLPNDAGALQVCAIGSPPKPESTDVAGIQLPAAAHGAARLRGRASDSAPLPNKHKSAGGSRHRLIAMNSLGRRAAGPPGYG